MKCIDHAYYGDIDANALLKEAMAIYPEYRKSEEYNSVYTKKDPLVSIITTTYNKKDVLFNYNIKSILNQTYKNFEVLIISDKCTDGTRELLEILDDDRFTFIDLKDHPPYPEEKSQRWQVAGGYASNLGRELAKGDFITYLDDDDVFVSTRLEKLVKFVQDTKADMVHHPFVGVPKLMFEYDGTGFYVASNEWGYTQITTSAVFFHNFFKRILADPFAWKDNEPGDWNKFKKFLQLGGKPVHYPEVLTIKGFSTTSTSAI